MSKDAKTLADELTDIAREHVAAGRGHMTWAECVVWLKKQSHTTPTPAAVTGDTNNEGGANA